MSDRDKFNTYPLSYCKISVSVIYISDKTNHFFGLDIGINIEECIFKRLPMVNYTLIYLFFFLIKRCSVMTQFWVSSTNYLIILVE